MINKQLLTEAIAPDTPNAAYLRILIKRGLVKGGVKVDLAWPPWKLAAVATKHENRIRVYLVDQYARLSELRDSSCNDRNELKFTMMTRKRNVIEELARHVFNLEANTSEGKLSAPRRKL